MSQHSIKYKELRIKKIHHIVLKYGILIIEVEGKERDNALALLNDLKLAFTDENYDDKFVHYRLLFRYLKSLFTYERMYDLRTFFLYYRPSFHINDEGNFVFDKFNPR